MMATHPLWMDDTVSPFLVGKHTLKTVQAAAELCKRTGITFILLDESDGSVGGTVLMQPRLDERAEPIDWHAVWYQLKGKTIFDPREAR